MRRRPGSGTIHQRARDGLWCAQTSFGSGPGRIRRTVYGATREEVEAKLRELNGGTLPPPRPPRPRTTMEIARAKADHTKAEWEAKRDAIGCCIYCGSPGPLVKDHATPIGKGGDNSLRNVVPACAPCNRKKRDLTAAEYALWMHFAEADQ